MKLVSLFYDQGGARSITTASAAQFKVYRAPKDVARTRIGFELAALKRVWLWEDVAFIALWLCGVFSVGYCLESLLSVP